MSAVRTRVRCWIDSCSDRVSVFWVASCDCVSGMGITRGAALRCAELIDVEVQFGDQRISERERHTHSLIHGHLMRDMMRSCDLHSLHAMR